MSDSIELRVPDIGDFKDVPVIEVLVKPGQRVAKEAPLVVLESEKASMEVPASAEGVVRELNVNVGDKVSQGSLIATLAPPDVTPSERSESKGATAPDVILSERSESKGATAPDVILSERSESKGATAELTVPDIGDFKDVPVIEVLVKAGDDVRKDAPLVVLESEKASMEVPASLAGRIADVRVKPGDRVSQGSVIATVVTQGEAAASPPASAPAAPAPPPAAPAASERAPGVASEPSLAPSVNGTPRNGALIHASPAIRRFARELGVDLHAVTGSGPHGRVTRDDVQHFVKRALQTPGAASSAANVFGLPDWPSVDFAQYGPVERKPLSRIKKLSGPNLHRNWLRIPHITNYDEADVTELEAFRSEINAEQTKRGGAKLTMLTFLIKAVVATLERFPEFNASLDGDELVYKNYYNIGFAADTPSGLVVPVIKDAGKKGLLAIAAECAELAGKARDGKLGLRDMQGGTFTISSLGGIGGTAFTQIVNAPEVAILGAVRAAMKPVWDGKQFVPRLMLPISVSYDHRVIDGAGAARFLSYLAALLADFQRVTL